MWVSVMPNNHQEQIETPRIQDFVFLHFILTQIIKLALDEALAAEA